MAGGCVLPIKDQGNCGSCWAFAVAESLEDRFCITKGVRVTLSPQRLVDCVTQSSGCKGGYTSPTWDYIANSGVPTESCFPYAGVQNTCGRSSCKTYQVSKAYMVQGYNNIKVFMLQYVSAWFTLAHTKS